VHLNLSAFIETRRERYGSGAAWLATAFELLELEDHKHLVVIILHARERERESPRDRERTLNENVATIDGWMDGCDPKRHAPAADA